MTYQRIRKPAPGKASAASKDPRPGPDRPAAPRPDAERDDPQGEAGPETASRFSFDFSKIQIHSAPPRRAEPNPSQAPFRRETKNRDGLPDPLKSGLEQMSGVDLSPVRVHYGSAKPRKLNAAAYARGDEIHLGPGQESFLPHEAWHIVQQRQGRVRPTGQVDGIAVNEDRNLEREAETLGTQALYGPVPAIQGPLPLLQRGPATPMSPVAQLGKLLDAKNLKTREEVLSYLQQGKDSKRQSEALQKEWNKEHPQEIITRPEWSQQVELPSSAITPVADQANEGPENAPLEEKQKQDSNEIDFEAYFKQHSSVEAPRGGRKPKKKKKEPKDAPKKGDVYQGPLNQIGRHHLPSNHPNRSQREGKLEHKRRASTNTIFTETGYEIAKRILAGHRRFLKVISVKPGGDILLRDEDSGLLLGVHTNGTVYPLGDNKAEFIE